MMRRSPSMGRRRPSVMLKVARKAIKREPLLKGALRDPEVILAADQVISAMRAAGILPTALNVLHHLLDQGVPEQRAAVLAAVAESRLPAPSRSG